MISGESRFPAHSRSNGVVVSRKWTLLTLIFFLCSSGALQANPLNSPGTVYINGLPCNRACQSYMAWSRPSPARHREEAETNAVVPGEAELVKLEHAARPRVARQPLPVPRPLPRAGMAASNAKPSNTRASHAKKAAAPKLAHQATKKAIPSAMATAIPEKTVEKPAAGGQQPERKLGSSGRVEPAQGASIAAVPPTERAKSEVANSEPAAPPPAKSEIAAPPAAPEVAALPAAAGGPPALAPPARANSIAAVPPTERPKSEVAKSEVAKSEVAKSEVAAPSPAKSEMAAPPAAPEIAAVPPTESPQA